MKFWNQRTAKTAVALWVAIILNGAISSCATMTMPEFRAKVMSDFRDNALSRAAFDMGCPEEELTVQDLNPQGETMWGSQVGVTGCGKKAVFVRTTYNGWVNNLGVETEQK